MEARIADIEVMLKNVKLINEEDLNNENIHIGSRIELEITGPDGNVRSKEYKIVGSNEANPREGRISDESAVGKALLGHQVGDTVDVEVPAGTMRYRVVGIAK